MPKHTPLVLLHGYPFDHSMWDPVRSLLPGDWQIAAPDLPGFGREPASSSEPSLDIVAEFIERQLAAWNISSAAVAGFSMGGYVALSLLEKFPNRVARLALINSQPFADSDEVRTGRRAMVERVRREGPEAASKAALLKLFAPGKANDPVLSGYTVRGAQAAGVVGITWALEAMARRPERTQVLQKMQQPLLIVHSTHDQFIPVERIREFARARAGTTYVEVPGAGHGTPLENPQAVARALIDFAPAP